MDFNLQESVWIASRVTVKWVQSTYAAEFSQAWLTSYDNPKHSSNDKALRNKLKWLVNDVLTWLAGDTGRVAHLQGNSVSVMTMGLLNTEFSNVYM